jgi:hypothetical protein
MAFKIADFDSTILPYKIINDTALSGTGGGTATAQIDVTQGESGKLYVIDLDNGAGNPSVFKMTFTEATVTVGTTNAQLIITVPASSKVRYVMPEGVAFTTLSMWCVTSAAVNGTTGPASAVQVTLITS